MDFQSYIQAYGPIVETIANFIVEYQHIIIGVFLIIGGISLLEVISGRLSVNLSASVTSGFVHKKFVKLAQERTRNEFTKSGRKIITQKGNFTAAFSRSANQKAVEMMKVCCSGNRFSDDFCSYVKNKYGTLQRRYLYDAISSYLSYRDYAILMNAEDFLNQRNSLTPEEFFKVKANHKGDCVGVYILHNETNGKYYVGQAKRLFFRINQHFTGHGNGDVYADYKYGDDFSIRIIKLNESEDGDLDRLEKYWIKMTDAKNSGYNKTAGNS